MKHKAIRVRWYPWVIALLFAAIFVFVIVKYVKQIKKVDGIIPASELIADNGETD